MSADSSMTRQSTKSFLARYWIPLLIVGLGGTFELVNYLTEFTSSVLLPQFATAAKYVLGRMVLLLIIGALLLWLLFTKQASWSIKMSVFSGVAVLVAIAFASIKSIENTGNNIWVIHYRWEKDQNQRLAEFNQADKTNSSATVDSAAVIPLDPNAPAITDFLGPLRNGIAAGPDLQSDLATYPPKELWRRPVGEGYAGCVMAGGLAVTIEQRGEQEVVVAYDLKTGKDRWTHGYPGHFIEDMGGNGPRATPTIAGDEVFSLGAEGVLVALDLASGKEKWKRNILNDAKATNITWGMSGSPLVTADKVLVNAGIDPKQPIESAIIAYDRVTGEKAWCTSTNKAAYSSPVLATLHDQQQLLLLDSKGVGGYSLDNGQRLWWQDFPTLNGNNIGQPIVLPNNQIFVSAGYDAGCLLMQLDKSDSGDWTVRELWRNKNMKCKMGSCVYHEGYIYGLDDAIFACLDATTGKRKWKGGRYGHGQFLLRNDVLVIQAESGDLVLVATDPNKHRELAKIPALGQGKTWNAPALAGNLLLLRNHFEAVLFEMQVK
jgi:outer membrane protein assembly factor BamB